MNKTFSILKDSLIYGATTFFQNFFKLFGYGLGAILFGVMSTAFLGYASFIVAQNQIASITLPTVVQAILIIAFISCSLYLAVSSVAILPRNMFRIYDKKSLSGFEGFFAPISLSVLLVMQMLMMGWMVFPGFLYILLKLGSPLVLNFVSEGGILSALIMGSFGWIFLLLMPFGLYFASRLILSFYIAVDTGFGAVASMKKSWEITGKNQLLFILQHLIFVLLSLIPLGALVFNFMYMFTHIYSYRKLSR